MAWRKRTGLTTANKLARALKTILTKYSDYLETILTTEQMGKVNSLIECCNLFITDVPQYDPTE
jgi:hypothetical protein